MPDERLTALAKVFTKGDRVPPIIPTAVEFVDIAGLVRGAHKGEGLGNQFLANIREVAAIAHVVRCFDDENIIHVEGRVDPKGDLETINTELALADLQSLEKRVERLKKTPGPSRKTMSFSKLRNPCLPCSSEGRPARHFEGGEPEAAPKPSDARAADRKAYDLCRQCR
jgi:ribosome-binding ATPase YchF (GTP1/OBG family)